MSLDERITQYNARIRGYEYPIKQSKWVQKNLTRAVGEPIMLPQQVRAAAWLLGYEDKRYSKYRDGPTGISSETYRYRIKPLIPEEARIKPSDYGRPKRHYGDVAFKTEAVRTALRRLGEERKLSYTDADFERVINLI